MQTLLVSSIQQYTIDRFRVNLSIDYLVDELENLKIVLYDEKSNDISDRLKTVKESNSDVWNYEVSANAFDLYLSKKSSLEEGKYTFVIYDNNIEVYRGSTSCQYMEDVRIEFESAELVSLDTLKVTMKSLYPEDNIYQTRRMLDNLNFSVFDSSNTSYSDVFESFSEILEKYNPEENLTEFEIRLKDKKVLPKGYYYLRLTSRYKNRTFSVVGDKFEVPFMTTTPPQIKNTYVSKRSNGEYIMTVIFDDFLEQSMLNSSKRTIISSSGKEVSYYFASDRISVTSNSTAGVTYITRLDIPLASDLYTLPTGEYTIKYSWNTPYFKEISYTYSIDWCLHSLSSVKTVNLDYIECKFPERLDEEYINKLKLLVELDGEPVENSDEIFDNVQDSNFMDIDTIINTIKVNIKNKSLIEEGTYSFIFYYVDKDGENYYDYIGSIDLINEITPNVTSVYQSDIDIITVVLDKPIPIDIIESCKPNLVDKYGLMDFSDVLLSIRNSNVWEPGQITTDRFNVVIDTGNSIMSGSYTFFLNFRSSSLKKLPVTLFYMEARNGHIESIEQISLSEIKIKFSQPQSRYFLLATELMVERKNDGSDFSGRFELLENVLKADEYVISELILPIDHEDFIPNGKYTISFIYNKVSEVPSVIYSYDVNLGYMTSTAPEISTITTSTVSTTAISLKVNFGSYLETGLFDLATFHLEDSNGKDVIDKFTPKEDWILTTVSKSGVTYIKAITMRSADEPELTFEKDLYKLRLEWDDSVEYIEDIKGSVKIDYLLPLIVKSEVVSVDRESGKARLYFEFDKVLQYSYFENLHVEVYDEAEEDVTDLFESVQKSNNINEDTPMEDRIATNNINLNIIDSNELSFGLYTFVFYHVFDGVRSSEYIGKLNILDALCPSIDTMEQVGIDTILVTLKDSVPRMLLECYAFTFESFKLIDYTSYFKSIDASNNWDEKIREVSSFYIKIKNGYVIGKGNYTFEMTSGSMKLDACDISIDHLEGADCEIEQYEIVNLSTLRVTFSSEQSLALYKSLIMDILDENGNSVADKFVDLFTLLGKVNTDYFDTLDLKLASRKSLAGGVYTLNIIKPNTYSDDSIIMSKNLILPYLSDITPILYNVSAIKSLNNKDAVILWFSPGLEVSLFNNSSFKFTNVSGMDVTERFHDIHDAVLDITEKDGIEYINYATIEFNPSYILEKDEYIANFSWYDSYAYMKNLSCAVKLDYILYPMKEVKSANIDTIELHFNTPLAKDYFKRAKLIVDSTYATKNDDGDVVTEVDFTDYFIPIQETNEDLEEYSIIYVKLKEGVELPNASYRFIIAENKSIAPDENQLEYAYAGTLSIDLFISNEIMDSANATLTQISYDTLQYHFDTPQNIKMLEKCALHVVKYQDGVKVGDYAGFFKSINASNAYTYKLDDGTIISGVYEDVIEKDIVIDEIHYNYMVTPSLLLKLNNNVGLKEDTYKVWLTYNNTNYFETEVDTVFMTSTPPNIEKMEIDDHMLRIVFSPYAEVTSLLESTYSIMTNNGLNEDGSVKGKDVSEYFGSISNSEMEISENSGIEYVKEILLPISKNAYLSSGKYTFNLVWNTRSLLPNITHTEGLSVLAKSIRSAVTYDGSTIKVTTEDMFEFRFLKSLNLSVKNEENEDCTDLFMSIKDSNPTVNDEDEVESFFIKVDDEVTSGIYTFTLSMDNLDTENSDSMVPSSVFVFGMSIVYLSPDFPVIRRIDNLSYQNRSIVKVTNENATSLFGHRVQIVTNYEDTKDVLSESNLAQYLNQDVYVYENASIDTLTVEFEEEVDPCLLNELSVSVLDNSGNDVSSYFMTPKDSNVFKSRNLLDFVEFRLNTMKNDEALDAFSISVYKANGDEITDQFLSVADSNELDGYSSTFYLKVAEDASIDEYEAPYLTYGVVDENGYVVTRFKTTLVYKTVSTTNQMNLKLNSDVTLTPDFYSITMSYQNEPGLDNSALIIPFSYNGDLPFLSNKVGSISMIETCGLSSLRIYFTENIPTSIFKSLTIDVINEDGETFTDIFEPLASVNDFDNASTLADMKTPYAITMQLSPNCSMNPGRYTFDLSIDLSSTTDETKINDNESYTLWSITATLPYMINEEVNNIKSVTSAGMDRVKIELENPVDINLIRTFNVQVESETNGMYYEDLFDTLSESNNFGKYILLTTDQFILHSEDGESWDRFNTDESYTFNDMVYDEKHKTFVIACSNGKILTFKEFYKTSVTIHNTKSTKNLTSILKIDDTYFVAGNDGTLMIGSFDGTSFTWNLVSIPTTSTLTSMIRSSEKDLYAVGYAGTILHSSDFGSSWEKVYSGVSTNLTSIVYYDNYVTEVDEDPEDEEDTEETVVAYNRGYYITGTNGTLLYSATGNDWKKLSVPTAKSLYSIAMHNEIMIAVGDSGTILRSEDGEDWELVDHDNTFTLKDVKYCDSKFIIAGSNGKWLTSLSGNVWTVSSTIYSDSLKSVNYIPSQYEDNRNVNYFYVKLRMGESLGAVEFDSGYEVPTLANNPAKYWKTDDEKCNHVGDIYTKYTIKNGITVLECRYQFALTKEYDEYGNITSSKFEWKDCKDYEIPANGSYTFEIRSSAIDLTDIEHVNPLYAKDGIVLPYLTSDPGIIRNVSIKSPDDIFDVNYQQPYIEIEFENGDENALYYSSYELVDPSGAVCYGLFDSLPNAIIKHSSNMTISSIVILGVPNAVLSMQSGKYSFNWIWNVFNKDEKISISNIDVKPMIELFGDVRPVDIEDLVIDMNGDPIENFFHTEEVDPIISIMKLPLTNTEDSTFNYYDNFVPLSESTDFTNPNYCENGKVKKIKLSINDSSLLNAGEYLLKMYNPEYPISSETMYVATKKFTLNHEITTDSPTIDSARIELISQYSVSSNNGNHGQFSGKGNPSLDENMIKITSSWNTKEDGDIRASHVGDIYEDADSASTYYYKYDSTTNSYYWEIDTKIPVLVITFGIQPSKNSIDTEVSYIGLSERDGDNVKTTNLDTYIYLNSPSTWICETVKIDNSLYVKKLKIPVNPIMNFPGTKNGILEMRWNSYSVYSNMELENVQLQSYIADYGTIQTIVPVEIPSLTSGESSGYGIQIKFQYPQLVDYLLTADISITHMIKDGDGNDVKEDISGYFISITQTNEEIFKENKTCQEFYMELMPDMVIDADTYEVEIRGDKPKDDISETDTNTGENDEDDGKIVFNGSVKIPWMTSNPPKNASFKLITSKSQEYPVLRIRFKDIQPTKSACENFKLQVTRQSDEKDFSKCFKISKTNQPVYYFVEYDDLDGLSTEKKKAKKKKIKKNPSSLVKYIDIKMTTAKCLPKGFYDCKFIFSKESLLNPIPIDKEYSSFEVDETIMTPLGRVMSYKANESHDKLEVTLRYAKSIDTDKKLRESVIGEELGVSSWNELLKALDLNMFKNSDTKTDYAEYFKAESKPNGKKKKITFTLESNKKINPGTYKVSLSSNDSMVFLTKKSDTFQGVIRNTIGKGDKICYILTEKHKDSEIIRVYKSYKAAKKRIKRMQKLNEINYEQYEKCAECRKKKLLSTSKIKSQIEKYDVPEGKMTKFVNSTIDAYYTNYVKHEVGCKVCKFESYDDVKNDGYNKFKCENYVTKETPYTWNLRIATMKTKFPKNKQKIFFEYIVKDDVRLECGFAATKKNKRPKKSKDEAARLEKYIKKYKSDVADCKKCRQKAIAKKDTKKIGWGSALFPDELRTYTKLTSKNLRNKLRLILVKKLGISESLQKTMINKMNAAYKKSKTGKGKKQKNCANFKFVKYNNKYCRLTCKNAKKADASLVSGSFKATYYK